MLSLTALCFVTGSYGVRAQTTPKFDSLDKVVLNELAANGIPGATIVVIQNGRVVFQKGFGIADVETKEPVTPDMLFKINSATKMFTAAALVTLAEDGKVDLHAPIGRYLNGLTSELSRITVHQLLSHTAGLKQWPLPGLMPSVTAPLRDVPKAFTNDYLFIEPGRVFSYSNPGYALSGALVETITGRPYVDYVADHFFKPLGMTRTTYDPATAMTFPFSHGTNPLPSGESQNIKRYAPTPPALLPSAGIISNGPDLAKFAIAFMGAGRMNAPHGLSASLVRKLSTPNAAFNQAEGDYGYGLRIYKHRGMRVVEHGGTGPGFGSLIYMVPSRRFAVIILTNKTATGRLYKVVDSAMDVVLRLKPQAADASRTLPMTPQEMAGYVGRYVNNTTVELMIKDGALIFVENDRQLPVTKVGERSFIAGTPGTISAVPFTLVAGQNGKTEFLYRNMVAHRKVGATSR